MSKFLINNIIINIGFRATYWISLKPYPVLVSCVRSHHNEILLYKLFYHLGKFGGFFLNSAKTTN